MIAQGGKVCLPLPPSGLEVDSGPLHFLKTGKTKQSYFRDSYLVQLFLDL